MIRKRSHILRYKEVISSDGYFDDLGNWVNGGSTERNVELICRADINSAGKTVPNNQGQDFVFSFTIYLDRIPVSLGRGTFVEIIENGKVKGSGTVVLPWGQQATNRVWV